MNVVNADVVLSAYGHQSLLFDIGSGNCCFKLVDHYSVCLFLSYSLIHSYTGIHECNLPDSCSWPSASRLPEPHSVLSVLQMYLRPILLALCLPLIADRRFLLLSMFQYALSQVALCHFFANQPPRYSNHHMAILGT